MTSKYKLCKHVNANSLNKIKSYFHKFVYYVDAFKCVPSLPPRHPIIRNQSGGKGAFMEEVVMALYSVNFPIVLVVVTEANAYIHICIIIL